MSECFFTQSLSDETLLIIFKYLNEEKNASATRNLMRLSQTCTKFRQLTEDKELCRKFIFTWILGEGGGAVSILSFVSFFKDTPRAALVTCLDVSDAYWIPSELLKDVAVQMVNLKELKTAGVDVWYSDIIGILKETPNLQKLSWSWDDRLEEAAKKFHPNAPFSPEFGVMEELISTNACRSLESLLIHIPMPKALEGVSSREMDEAVTSYSCLAYWISKCLNLEELWILCWPRTRGERLTRPHWPLYSASHVNQSTHHLSEGIPDGRFLELNKLKNMVVFGGSTQSYSRIACHRLITLLRRSIVEGGCKSEMLWIDHPSMDISIIKTDRYPAYNTRAEQDSFPHVQYIPLNVTQECRRLSFSFWPYLEWSCRKVPIPRTLTHLLITKTDLRNELTNVLADGESNLKSFYAKNCPSSLMDLNLFVTLHTNLQEICIPSFIQGMGEYCIHFLKLQNLRKVSFPLDCLLKIRNTEAVETYHNNLLSSSQESSDCEGEASHAAKNSAPCGIDLLAVNCPLMEEVEIGFDTLPPRVPSEVDEGVYADSISGIARWTNLRKLTLVNVPILNTQDFVDICTNCKALQSLRLTRIGNTGGPFFKHLISKVLPTCKNLQDFRLEQDMIGPPSTIIKALSHCPKLRRLLIWSGKNYQSLTKAPVLQLFRDCPNLVMFYSSIDSTQATTCLQITKAVESEFKSKRRSLSVIIRGLVDSGELIRYPSVHYRQMVENEPQVCQITDFSEF